MTPRTYASYEAMLAAIDRGEITGAVHVVTLHDDSCPAPGAVCVCSPEYLVEDLTEETVLRGARAQREWMRRGQS